MDTIEYYPLSEDEYQRFEARSPVKHEYLAGEIFAMTGGTLRHNLVAGNLFVALRTHLGGSPCRVFMNDVRLRVEKARAFYYPDLLVGCGADATPLTATQVDDAVLVIEVVAPGTEATDGREKLIAYRTLPGLAEYLLVSQDRAHVELHRRRGDIGWQRIECTGFETVQLTSIGMKLDLQSVYDGVTFDPRSAYDA
jgi:Uma2 family endonuclease